MTKWNFENWLMALGIFLGYSLSWFFGWQLSVNFETIADISSWFLPAGIRVSSLLLFNKKYWGVIALAEFTAIYAVNSTENPFATSLGEAVGTFLPILIYMLVTHLYLKSSHKVRFDSLTHVVKLFSWIGFGTLLTAGVLVSSLMFQGQLIKDQLITTILLFMLGDIVGILLLVPVAVAIKYLLDSKKTFIGLIKSVTWPTVIMIIISLFIAVLLVMQSMTYYIKIFAFIPIIIFSYRNGWLGAAFSIFMINIIIVLASFVSEDMGTMLEKQLYLIAISMTGLLLGTAISEQKLLNFALVRKNDELLIANSTLRTLIEKNQQLAQKIVDIQEDERKYLSRELHDEIGQNITALKLHINVIKQMSKEPEVITVLDAIENIADITYESAYNLMHSLRPRVLDELGLEVALTSGSFNQLLNCAEIKFITNIEGDLSLLNEQLKIAIYRISQETINNAIKYSKARHLWLSLIIQKSNLHLEIKDDGIGFDTVIKDDSGFGLQGIEDRVTALGGDYSLTSNTSGTTHSIHLKISN